MLLTRHHRDIALVRRRFCRVKIDGMGGLDAWIDLEREIDRVAFNHADKWTWYRAVEGPCRVGNILGDVEDVILRRERDLFCSCLDRFQHRIEKLEWLHRLPGKL